MIFKKNSLLGLTILPRYRLENVKICISRLGQGQNLYKWISNSGFRSRPLVDALAVQPRMPSTTTRTTLGAGWGLERSRTVRTSASGGALFRRRLSIQFWLKSWTFFNVDFGKWNLCRCNVFDKINKGMKKSKKKQIGADGWFVQMVLENKSTLTKPSDFESAER